MKRISFIVASALFVACSGNKTVTTEIVKPVEEIEVVTVDTLPNEKNEYIITDEVFLVLQEEPENHFEKAKQNIAAKDLKGAAAEIQKATVYLDLEIQKAEEKDKQKLIVAKQKLEALAGRLKKGMKVEEAELGQAYYDADVAMYGTYVTQFDSLTTNSKTEKRGVHSYLDAALQKLESAEKWSSKKFDKTTHKTIDEGKALSHKIKNGLKEDKEAIKKEWAAFRKKLKDLDDKLEGDSDGTL